MSSLKSCTCMCFCIATTTRTESKREFFHFLFSFPPCARASEGAPSRRGSSPLPAYICGSVRGDCVPPDVRLIPTHGNPSSRLPLAEHMPIAANSQRGVEFSSVRHVDRYANHSRCVRVLFMFRLQRAPHACCRGPSHSRTLDPEPLISRSRSVQRESLRR